jgi:predicted transport protein
MAIFKIESGRLSSIPERKISLEKNIQKLTEDNLETIFGYKFIASELRVDSFRFDTLAWNPETNSFIIIEYKKDRNFSIVDQGFSYLSLLANKKEFFLFEYSEHTKKHLRREDVDWSSSRVVFISPAFTPHQINSVNFKDMAFDLFEIKLFENNTVLFSQIRPTDSSESIDLFLKDSKLKSVVGEIKNYTIDKLFKENWKESREIFDILSERVVALDPNLNLSPTGGYVGCKIGNQNVVDVKPYRSFIDIHLLRVRPEDLNDPEKRVTYRNFSMEHYNKHISVFRVVNTEDIDYAMMLIKQVYKKFNKKLNV